ncbi:MAG: cation diffusion facilitator family transporter [Deltaproteobacteria bacterium]|nr:cation diffusion facilitator family transporter [Deltaproteobacteria bacterium]
MSHDASSHRAVVAALVANSGIAVAKFVAFALSGSGAMLSEGVHSLADTGNQFLLFVGLRRSRRPGDPQHPYGYGAERYVFGILSAAGIFFVGCGVTVYHGIRSFLHPHAPEFGWVTVAVLAVSFVLESISMVTAVAAVRAQMKGRSFGAWLRDGSDPTTLAILLEDGCALLGLLLAGAAIAAAWATGEPRWDALGSTLVGALLGIMAIYLAGQNRTLLLGRAVPPAFEARFRRIAAETPGVEDVHAVMSRQVTPERFKFKAEITLDLAWLADRLAEALPPEVASEPSPLASALADRAALAVSDLVDDLEARVRAAIPEAAWIDVEVDHTALRRERAGRR